MVLGSVPPCNDHGHVRREMVFKKWVKMVIMNG
jgi:hypothetical protein